MRLLRALAWPLALAATLAAGLVAVGIPAAATAAVPRANLTWSYPEPLGPASLGGVASGLTGIQCPQSRFCMAADRDGALLFSLTPAGGPTTWTVLPLAPGEGFAALSCPTAQLCAAATADGRVFTSRDPGAGAPSWTPATLPAVGTLTAIACTGSGLCAVTDDAGDVATTQVPPAGAATWSTVQVDSATHGCGDGTTCQAGLTSIACPSASLCVAFDQIGNVVASANPQGGAEAWNLHAVDARGMSSARPRAGCDTPLCMIVSCPAVSLCVALDSAGNAVTSTDPLGPATSWVARPLDPLAGAPTALDCAGPSACVLVDASRELLRSANPSGGAPAWSLVPFSSASSPGTPAPSIIPRGIACPSPTECLAPTAAGLLVSRPPATVGQLGRLLRAAATLPVAVRRIRTLVAQRGYQVALNAPQAGRIRLTLTLLPAAKPRPSRKKKTPRLPRVPIRLASIQQTLLGPGLTSAQVSFGRAARRALAARQGGTIVLSATILTTTGTALRQTRSFTVKR